MSVAGVKLVGGLAGNATLAAHAERSADCVDRVERGRYHERMEWKDCEAVEEIPGKMGGRPVVKGTRIEPDTIVQDYELGSPVEEIHENFPTIPVDTIRRLLAYAHAHQPALNR